MNRRRRAFGRSGALALVVALGTPASVLLLWPTAAGANTTIVAQDSSDGAPVGADCAGATPTSCSLRDAFAKSNADSGDDVIDVQLGSATIMLTAGTLDSSTADQLTVTGNGVTVQQTAVADVISSSGGGKLAIDNTHIVSGQAGVNGADVLLTNSTVTGPTVSDGVYASTQATVIGSTVAGGVNGVHVFGNATVIGSTVTGGNGVGVIGANDVIVSASTVTGASNGVDAGANVTVTNSTVTGNSGDGVFATNNAVVSGSTVTGSANGVDAGVDATVTNSTVTGNGHDGVFGGTNVTVDPSTVTGADNGVDAGGNATVTGSTVTGTANDGVFGGSNVVVTSSTVQGSGHNGVDAGVDATVTNSTVTNNGRCGVAAGNNVTLAYATVVQNGAGACGFNLLAGANLTSFGSVVALAPSASTNCHVGGSTISQGYNHDDSGTCGFGLGAGDESNKGDPLLGALGANGGPTPTRVPQAGSPLIDKIPASSPCGGVNIVVDQRGLPRPTTGGQFCDIGAVEVQPLVVARFTG